MVQIYTFQHTLDFIKQLSPSGKKGRTETVESLNDYQTDGILDIKIKYLSNIILFSERFEIMIITLFKFHIVLVTE
jgi:hypothetical protein